MLLEGLRSLQKQAGDSASDTASFAWACPLMVYSLGPAKIRCSLITKSLWREGRQRVGLRYSQFTGLENMTCLCGCSLSWKGVIAKAFHLLCALDSTNVRFSPEQAQPVIDELLSGSLQLLTLT